MVVFPAYEIGTSQLINLVRGLHDHGVLHKVLLIAPASTLKILPAQPPWFIADNSESPSAIIEKIEQLCMVHRLSLQSVMAVDEEMQFQLSARIAHHFHLPFYRETTCRTASVKYLAKKMFHTHQVPTGAFELISEITPAAIEKIGFPNVLKPLAGTQSHFIFCNHNEQELRNHFAILSQAAESMGEDPRFSMKTDGTEGQEILLDPKRQFLLETYISGEELSCDFMVQGDRLDIIRLVKKIPAPMFGMFRGYTLLSETAVREADIDMVRLIEICRRIATGFDLDRGICMVDFKINDGEIFVLEATIRPGLSAFNHLMYAQYGYTSPLLLALLHMGGQIDLDFPETGGMVVFLYAPHAGYLQNMDIHELLSRRQELGVLAVHRFTEEACPVHDSEVDHSDLIQGYVLIAEAPSANSSELADTISSCVKYQMEPL
jgi:hypothetical protein